MKMHLADDYQYQLLIQFLSIFIDIMSQIPFRGDDANMMKFTISRIYIEGVSTVQEDT